MRRRDRRFYKVIRSKGQSPVEIVKEPPNERIAFRENCNSKLELRVSCIKRTRVVLGIVIVENWYWESKNIGWF